MPKKIEKTKRSIWERTKRYLSLKLVIPLKRSDESAVFGARGVMVGMMWAMTPLVGIQMTTVLITWVILSKIFKWNFSLPIALAFTWVTNVFTMWPIYYGFYATGKVMMGDWENISAYASFLKNAHNAFAGTVSPWELGKATMVFVGLLFKDWGTAMVVGCIPWALISGIAGYYITYKWLVRYHETRANREERRKYWHDKIAAGIQKSKEAVVKIPHLKRKKGNGKKQAARKRKVS